MRDLTPYLPKGLPSLVNPQTALPRIAKDSQCIRLIEEAVQRVPTTHTLYAHDARALGFLPAESLHLILTSPPYWTLKHYPLATGQLGNLRHYAHFLAELGKVWEHCYRVLVPGGRLICVVGDVCLSRRANQGRHTVVPLHAAIQEQCRAIGFDNLAPILWYKIANAVYEGEQGSAFLGKPYEPNAVIKNDLEFILMQRKPGGYRKPCRAARVLSMLSAAQHHQWFQQIWQGLPGASTRHHPAPYPLVLATRLIRMFSFVGDTVLDPFMGTGTTNLAAAHWGRHSLGCELDEGYVERAYQRLLTETQELFRSAQVHRVLPETSPPSGPPVETMVSPLNDTTGSRKAPAERRHV